MLGLLRRRHGGKGFLEFGILDDDRVFERLNLSLEDGDLAAGGGGVKGSWFVQGCLYILRCFGAGFLEFLVQVLDAKTHDRRVPIRIAGLQGGQVIPSLPVFLDGGVFLPESGQIIRLSDEGIGLNKRIVRARSLDCGQEAK